MVVVSLVLKTLSHWLRARQGSVLSSDLSNSVFIVLNYALANGLIDCARTELVCRSDWLVQRSLCSDHKELKVVAMCTLKAIT